MNTTIDTVVVGAGQAGLATGYFLARRGLEFTILERHPRPGESWRRRWDSLRVFTPARMDGLPGMPFPAPAHSYPTKDEVADYLERYAQQMDLPVQLGVDVRRLAPGAGSRFALETDKGGIGAERVIVASGAWHAPRVPSFAVELAGDIRQLHSSEFRNPGQLGPGAVLVVGGGNSGAEIAALVARERETWLVGPDTGQLPFDIDGPLARWLDSVIWFMANHVLTIDGPVGRRLVAKIRDRGAPLERVRPRDLEAAGVQRIIGRVSGVSRGRPVLGDGRALDVSNVIWATGFRHDLPWIELDDPVTGEDGWPLHERGVSTTVPGLYFVGLPFQRSMASPLIGGVGRDARAIVDRVAAEARVRRLEPMAA
jgi:putative flavoprotein involved in K+ transport